MKLKTLNSCQKIAGILKHSTTFQCSQLFLFQSVLTNCIYREEGGRRRKGNLETRQGKKFFSLQLVSLRPPGRKGSLSFFLVVAAQRKGLLIMPRSSRQWDWKRKQAKKRNPKCRVQPSMEITRPWKKQKSLLIKNIETQIVCCLSE